MIQRNLVQPLDDYIDWNHPLESIYKEENARLKYKGKKYVNIHRVNLASKIYYNSKIFEANGLDTPDVYYKKGEWDWNSLQDLAKELTLDTDGDGTTDLWGFSTNRALDPWPFIATTGKNWIEYDERGNLVNNLDDKDVARAVNYYQDLIHKHKVLNPADKANKVFLNGTAAMGLSYPGSWIKAFDIMKAGEGNFLPIAKDPEAEGWHYGGNIQTRGLMMGKGCANPKGGAAMIAIWKYFFCDLDLEQMKVVWDDQRTNRGFNDFSYEVLDFGRKSMKSVLPYFELLGDTNKEIQKSISNGLKAGTPWYSITAQIKPILDTAIAEFK